MGGRRSPATFKCSGLARYNFTLAYLVSKLWNHPMLWISSGRLKLILAATAWSFVSPSFAPAGWYRGNTHTHTVLCGHGDSSPEAVTQWYHDRGYNFLILSEHNIFIDPETVKMPQNKRSDFILIPGQEVTGKPIGVHTTAMNTNGLIPWKNQETDTKAMVIQEHIHHTHQAGGIPILNHPHGGSAITSQDILPVENFQMMEVYNANTKRNNLFKRRYLNLPLTAEPLWDELLTAGKRVYGVGSDDAHTFLTIGPDETNDGLGWVMVNADTLDPAAITEAMHRGEFYASNGVSLSRCDRGTGAYTVEIDEAETQQMIASLPDWAGLRCDDRDGLGYRIEFVGPHGRILNVVKGNQASFSLSGPESYVRARAVWVRKRDDGDLEAFYAWGQPAFAQASDYVFLPTDALPSNPKHPDPFLKPDGTRVSGLEEWPEQRAYLKALAQHYLYGYVPPRPSESELSVRQLSDEAYMPPDSSIKGRKQGYQVTIARNGLEHSFTFNLWRPDGEGRFPTLINNYPEHGHPNPTYSMEEGVRRGYALVEFDRTDVAPDEKSNVGREEGIFRLYPKYDFQTIAAWGWAYQPVIDVLDRLKVVDMEKIIVTGHSRGGQAAMAGGIFDERIAIVAPSTGGPFSLGSTRQRDPDGYRGTMDYADNFKRKNAHWYHDRYFEFVGKQNKQPWDAPTLAALIAPRPLINFNALGDRINNGLAHEVGVRAGREIYRWMGAEDWCRIHWRGNENEYGQKGHDQGPEEFNAIYDFADEFFFGKPKGPSTYNQAPGSDTWTFNPFEYPILKDWNVPE